MAKSEDCFHLGVKALIRNADGKILLLKVNLAHLTDASKEYWDIPGGRIQRGDTIEQTLRREVKEETGIASVRNIQSVSMVLSNIRIPLKPQDVGLILAVFTCEIDADAHIVLSGEHTTFGWFEPKEAAVLLQFKYPPEFTDKIAGL